MYYKFANSVRKGGGEESVGAMYLVTNPPSSKRSIWGSDEHIVHS